ncbi:VOC family protein [Fibrobacterota bacterium]
MKLHHIGKVVENIGKEIDYYRNVFGFQQIGKSVIDPIQKVEVAFIETGLDRQVTIELIHPVEEASPVMQFLKEGGGLHHLCYQVDDINQALKDLKAKGCLILSPPVPGKGHDDRLTLWLYTPEKELIELVEKTD